MTTPTPEAVAGLIPARSLPEAILSIHLRGCEPVDHQLRPHQGGTHHRFVCAHGTSDIIKAFDFLVPPHPKTRGYSAGPNPLSSSLPSSSSTQQSAWRAMFPCAPSPWSRLQSTVSWLTSSSPWRASRKRSASSRRAKNHCPPAPAARPVPTATNCSLRPRPYGPASSAGRPSKTTYRPPRLWLTFPPPS